MPWRWVRKPRAWGRADASDKQTRPIREREFSVNLVAVLLWIARRLGEGLLPMVGGELGRVIWGAISGVAAAWAVQWLGG